MLGFHSAEFSGKVLVKLRKEEFFLLVQQLRDLGCRDLLRFVLA